MGHPESELAATLRAHEAELGGLEITTCLRDGELEVVTRFAPDAQDAYDRFERLIAEATSDKLFSADGRTVDDIVADALLERGLTIATAESCTAGLLAGPAGRPCRVVGVPARRAGRLLERGQDTNLPACRPS